MNPRPATERVLDVSDLEPPEPLEQALRAVADLRPGEYLRMLHRREPLLLYPILTERGYEHVTRTLGPGRLEILIWRCGDTVAESACRPPSPALGPQG